MHRFYFDFQATVLCLLMFAIVSQLIKPSAFTSLWVVLFLLIEFFILSKHLRDIFTFVCIVYSMLPPHWTLPLPSPPQCRWLFSRHFGKACHQGSVITMWSPPPPPPFSVQGSSGGLRGGRDSRGYGSWGTKGIPTQWEQQGTQRGKE